MEKLITFKLFAGSDGTGTETQAEEQTKQEAAAEKAAPAATETKPAETHPSDAEAKLLKEVMAKKEKINQQEKQIEELTKVSEAIKALGGIESLTKMVQDKQAAEQEALEKKGEWDKLKAQMVEAHQKELGEYKTKLSDLESKLKAESSKISQLTLGNSFSNSAFLKKTVLTSGKAQAIYGDYFDIGEDGKVMGYDKPRGAAGRTLLVDGQGNAVDFEAAISRIIEADPDKDSLLRTVAKTGAGSSTVGAKVKMGSESSKPSSGISMILAGLSKK